MAIIDEKVQFEITIKRKTTIRFDTKTDSLSEERHYTDKEREEGYNRWNEDPEKEKYTKKIYTQVPATGTRTDEIEIFSQIIDNPEFEIKKVIGAINDLKQ